jgi:ubiquinone/menaquinone biosynthesis C-methylase UbiE
MFADPIKNLRQFGLREDMIVADLGAGTGFYSLAAAKMVPKGKVYAIEVVKDYIVTIKDRAKELGLNNLECFWGNIEEVGGTKIKEGMIDAVIVSNILFQVEDKERLVNEIKRILKPEGKILLVDWTDGLTSFGPKPEQVIPKNKAREIFEKKNFILEREIDAGSHHYGMILIHKK